MRILVLNGSPKKERSYSMPAALKTLVDRMLPLSSMAMARENGRYVHVGQRGAIENALLAEISEPMIPEETYAKIVNVGV